MSTSDEYRRGYVAGKEAGRMEALREYASPGFLESRPPRPRPKRLPLPAERRCDCGHADVTHNELGYCQGKQKYADAEMRKHADQCECDSFTNDHDRAIFAERDAKRALVHTPPDFGTSD